MLMVGKRRRRRRRRRGGEEERGREEEREYVVMNRTKLVEYNFNEGSSRRGRR
jgi:hypothetical protein